MAQVPSIEIGTVQRKLGVPPSGHWDAVTMGALLSYQGGRGAAQWPMFPNGHPDPPTLANLGYYDPVAELDPAWRDYVTGKGSKPSTFGRDLASATNQMPQWAWLAIGAALLGAGFWTWHRSRSRA